ncbi:MAG TPA: hypothetical protein VIM56_08900 [Rhizomicrobium sp.]
MRWLRNGLFSLAIAGAVPAWAGPSSPPLAPGQAAGIQTAQSKVKVDKLAIVGGLALGAAAIYLIVGTHYNDYIKPQPKAASSTH